MKARRIGEDPLYKNKRRRVAERPVDAASADELVQEWQMFAHEF